MPPFLKTAGTLIALTLTACVAAPVQPPNHIIEDAHGGGNILRFNSAATRLASGGWAGNIRIWSLPDLQPLRRWQAHEDSIEGLTFLSDGRLVSAGYDSILAVWNRDGTPARRVRTPSPVTALVADPDNNRVLTGHNDGVVRTWRLPGLVLAGERLLHTGTVRSLARHAASGRIASGGADARVFLWMQDGPARELPSPGRAVWTLAFSPDGKRLSGGGWFRLFRWDMSSGDLKVMDTEHAGIIKSLHYGRDGTLASISRQTDSAVYFLDPDTGAVTRRFQPHDLCGADIRLSPDGRFLATTSDDASVRLWDLDAPLAQTTVY